MEASSSYRPEEHALGIDGEIARLAVQADLSWDEERRILERAGLCSSYALLEVGCGPGIITEKLLDAAERPVVTAIDVRSDFLTAAKARLAPHGPRARVVAASILGASFDAGSFDFIVARYVVQHLADPQAAVAEMFRLLAPGGTAVVIEVDAALLAVAQPFAPQLVPIYARAERLQGQRGGSRLLGRRLWRLLSREGFAEVRHEAFVYHSDAIGLEPFAPQMDPRRLLPALDAGLITPDEYATVAAHHEAFFASSDSFVMMIGFAGTGRKPEHPA